MKASTGIAGLDHVLEHLRLGDNVVWQVDSIASYLHFVTPYIKQALADNKKIVYIRFAQHPPLIKKNPKIKVYELEAEAGFEAFSKEIHDIATAEGEGVFYLFDCLSDLLEAWATDLMIGNFFMVTCPYLFKLDTIAYFAILRNSHSYKTIARIRETTQLLLDVFNFDDKYYVHPLKVWRRYSPTMFLPHVEAGDKFEPIVSSVDTTKLFSYMSSSGSDSAERQLDYWDHLFLDAQGACGKEEEKMFERLSKIILGREKKMSALIKKHLKLEDLLAIKERMIGTGFIGGKALGMLLARKILKDFAKVLEPHDSFYIGSDVFYTYIVENGWWDLWMEQKSEAGYLVKAAELREKILTGKFPEDTKEKFHQLIEYFGQSPIIIRSSSLLEDSFGNAFAGKYESIFCVNQGSPDERYKQFKDIVLQVFASTINEDALQYRLQRGLNEQNEQMALLVQRVSGSHHGDQFFPYMAGVGFSYNTFVWHESMDPKAGMLRLVFGLGTRAVNRVEGDYPRIVALDAPDKKPYVGIDKLKRFSQHEVDLLNIADNQLQTLPLSKITDVDLSMIGERDIEAEKKLKELGLAGSSWVLTFDKLFKETDFVKIMQQILKKLEKQYQYPVDIEFTVNFDLDNELRINLIQCRPLQAKGRTGQVKIPQNIKPENLIFKSSRNFMGGSVEQAIKRLIYVDPKAYGELLMPKKFEVARLIGRLNKTIANQSDLPTLMIGPGRWGTKDPTLGVPVNFAEINNIAVLVELDDPDGGFMPELSFGSHFFLDLVETNIFYVALFMDDEAVSFNQAWIAKLANKLLEIIPEANGYEKAIKVYDFADEEVRLLADLTLQKVVCLK
ncbi:phosphoenolpyruvate synthase [Candidatus Saganbacteria bacterium CG08_land_8_20_14_0_20_45_16]|uniref:Phosphoenolpyruvate synthase n=1 Tax=Candidatus Saganbacteria bacterium CG08_land_8_20_14_0_20_45_16 TaxID=2014293 RepID=A0A2H0XUI8_UNCSA|nr:MAG: phosphoenolpyruvate synthase [Candidatus Saganbacteria bacterium CG08_land_8_20_14_0_20_45_16]